MKKIGLLLLVFILLAPVFVNSCGDFSGFKRNYAGNNTPSHISATYDLLDGTQTKYIGVKAGQTITFTYTSTVEKGTLTMTVKDPSGKTVVEFTPGTSGTESITADKGGNFKLIIKGDDNKGSFDIRWEIK